MEQNAFIDFNSLSKEAIKELESFYQYLVFKYKKKTLGEKKKYQKRFGKFLSDPIKVDNFIDLNREERNAR